MPGRKPCEPGCTCGHHNRLGLSPEGRRERKRAQDLEKVKRYQARNPEKVSEYQRSYQKAHPEIYRGGGDSQRRYMFGIEPEQLAEMWEAQQGCCYMCREPLDMEAKRGFVIDHDRSHCRGRRSCGDCILGLACDACNVGCGRFGDDPDRMERAAAARRAAMASAAERIDAKPVQAELPINVAPLKRRKDVG